MSGSSLRVDRWLWFTRFFKTRAAASKAVQGGHVRINGERARASTLVRPGDEIQVARRERHYELTVLAVPLRRGPAAEASACYSESEDSIARRKRVSAELRRDRLQMPMTPGKPDKHTRRQLRARKLRQ